MATMYNSDPMSDTTLPVDSYDIILDDSPTASQPVPIPPPNPNFSFSFPAQPSMLTSTTTPKSPSRRRPMSPIVIDNYSQREDSEDHLERAPLPAFSFNPGASLPIDPDDTGMLSPPTSPGSARPTPSPSRPVRHGHRRGGSEFVGGSIRDGNSIAVMSTSPTKDNGFIMSTLQPPPRRGHRRGVSGTISTNDLPILQPPIVSWTTPKGSSAPNSPTNFDQGVQATIPILDEPAHLSILSEPLDDPLQSEPIPKVSMVDPLLDTHKSQRPASKARVGFSDTLEFIPRPLSLISSDTSSTVTARPAHSVSGSISSVVVSPTSSSDREALSPVSRTSTRDFEESRPSTAGAILDRATANNDVPIINHSPKRRNSIPALIGAAEVAQMRAPASSNTAKTTKRWSFFGLESFTTTAPVNKNRSVSSSSSETGQSSELDSEDEAAATDKNNKKKGKKSKVKKGVKGWAGAILPIKTKSDKKRTAPAQVRPPTPPSIGGVVIDDEEDEEMTNAQPPTPTIILECVPAPSFKKSSEDVAYPMIDLDAALGPFNTPLPHNPEWEAAQRAAGNVGKRRLHSAQGLKGFSGPGMHYHRRAESAPDLPPFDAGRAGIHRFGSSSTMADVFEEDEEDEPNNNGQVKKKLAATATTTTTNTITSSANHSETELDSSAPPSATTLIHKNSTDSGSIIIRRTGSGLSDKDQLMARSIRTECSRTSLHENVIMEEPAWGNTNTRSPSFSNAGRDSFDSGAPSPKKLTGGYEIGSSYSNSPNMPNGTVMPLSPYPMSPSSSHPSPRSPMSLDAQRISTAPSSIADESCFQSLLMGEPGPEVRISMDYDIPSLTSSTSTMTRESAFVPTARPFQPALREPRPVSVSSAAFGRRRSSLISLSRLISSSHGERSKLSTELTIDNDSDNRSPRKGKKNRLGRMMQFWKPNKEGTTVTRNNP